MSKAKNIFLFPLILLFSGSLFSPERYASYLIEYSPNFSKMDVEVNEGNTSGKLSHNIFIKADIPLSEKISIVPGVGFLNTGYIYSRDADTLLNYPGSVDIVSTKRIINSNFIAVNLGTRILIKHLFISPEIGLAFYSGGLTKTITTKENGDMQVTKRRETGIGLFNFKNTILPLSLSFGYEFNLFNSIGLVGFKGFYALPTSALFSNTDTFGIGLLLGLRFD